MTTPYTGNPDSFHDTIQVIAGTDSPSGCVFGVGLEALADNCAYLQKHIDTALMNWLGPYALPNATGVAIGYAYPATSTRHTYIAVGGTDKISYSNDARIWSAITPSGAASITLDCIATDGAGVWLCGGGGATSNILYRSTDNGATWAATGVLPGLLASKGIHSVIWNPALSLFIATSVDDSTGYIATSPTGSSWTKRTSALALNLTRLACNPTSGITVCLTDASGSTTLQSSLDGITWTSRTVPQTGRWFDVCYSVRLGAFFACNADGDIVKSTDGISWQTVRVGNQNYSLNRIAAFDGKLIVVAQSTGPAYDLFSSYDTGATWLAEGVGANVQGLVVAKNRLLASYAGGLIATVAFGDSEVAVF